MRPVKHRGARDARRRGVGWPFRSRARDSSDRVRVKLQGQGLRVAVDTNIDEYRIGDGVEVGEMVIDRF